MAEDDNGAETAAAAIPGRVFFLDGRGGIVETSDREPAAGRRSGFQLVALAPDDAECIEWLAGQFGQVAAEAMAEKEPRPHCTIYDDGALIALIVDPLVGKEAGADAPRSRHAQFWVERGRCVVMSNVPIEELVGATPGKGKQQAPSSPIHVITRVALRAADRIEPQLDALSEKTDDLEEEVLDKPTDRTRVRLNQVRRAAIVMRRTLLPQRDALTTLETAAYEWFTQRDRARLREAVGWSTRLAAETATFSERAALVQDQIMDRRSEQLNRALLILAAVTTIFMPLTLITGLLGMNVAGIPFAGSPWAFGVIVGAVIVIGFIQYLWFRSQKWL